MAKKKSVLKNSSNSLPKIKSIQGTNFRWVVPQLDPEIWGRKQTYKYELLDLLRASKTARKGLKFYSLAVESHADGNPHLDLLLIFEKKVRMSPVQLDFLCGKHGELTRYRTLNRAILEYGYKEDDPLTNLQGVPSLLNAQAMRKDPVGVLMKQVDKNPFLFNFVDYCGRNNYFSLIDRWAYVKQKIKDYQQYSANEQLRNKRGFAVITQQFIRQALTEEQYKIFDSKPFYRVVVDYLNQIPKWGWNRPTHSKQLYIRGKSRIGKTSMIELIQKFVAVYPVGTVNWFPQFTNQVYRLMFWDQARLRMMSFNQLLMLMDGRPFHLPFKGGSTPKRDNQLWILCSNESLQSQMVSMGKSIDRADGVGGNYTDQQVNAVFNRLHQVVIPDNCDLFLIQKLIVEFIN